MDGRKVDSWAETDVGHSCDGCSMMSEGHALSMGTLPHHKTQSPAKECLLPGDCGGREAASSMTLLPAKPDLGPPKPAI
jgi:hypothetical protein